MSARLRLMAVLLVAMVAFVGLAGSAFATDGDTAGTDGSATGTKTDVPIYQTDADGNPVVDETGAKVPAEPKATDEYVGQLAENVGHNRVSLNLFFLMIAGVLVFFMQAGFAFVETGFTRAKNASHVMMTNFMIFSLGMLGFWLVGYSFMFGSATAPAIGLTTAVGKPLISFGNNIFLSGGGWGFSGKGYDVSFMAFFFFQVVFMDTMATIPTGAMAERWKFSAFCIYGLACGILFYPIFGNWVWGGGWLSTLGKTAGLGHGAVDFAGSGVVHAVGGITALTGAMVLGPRIGKYGKKGEINTIAAHDIPMAILGCFILMFGWWGFNGGSTFAATETRFTIVIVNTFLAGMAGCLVAMCIAWWGKSFGKPDPGMAVNGFLAGLVAITAPCAFVHPFSAVIIGALAGVLVYVSMLFFDRKAKIDDPVGAISVHGMCGLWGVMAVGIFADGTYGVGLNGIDGGVKGALYGDWGQLAAQAIDAVVLVVFIGALTYAFFKIQDKLMGLRPAPEVELAGLDIPEMGILGYPDFLKEEEIMAEVEAAGMESEHAHLP